MNNLLILIGRITKDLELRYTKENKAVLEVPIAVNNGENDATFINVSVFGKAAENTAKYCSKGSLLGIRAMVKNHNWEDKEGKKHYDYSFIASQITFLNTNNKSIDVGKVTEKELKVKSQPKITDDVFSEFGNSIEITDEDVAF